CSKTPAVWRDTFRASGCSKRTRYCPTPGPRSRSHQSPRICALRRPRVSAAFSNESSNRAPAMCDQPAWPGGRRWRRGTVQQRKKPRISENSSAASNGAGPRSRSTADPANLGGRREEKNMSSSVTLVGGLGFFLLGIHHLTEGLKGLAGDS